MLFAARYGSDSRRATSNSVTKSVIFLDIVTLFGYQEATSQNCDSPAGGLLERSAAHSNWLDRRIAITPQRHLADCRQRDYGSDTEWCAPFLDHLAESSNVKASARKAKTTTSKAYKLRRENAEFAAHWLAALFEGYVHLEMEVLRRLRDGDLKAKGEDKYDFANAIRLLGAHRENAARAQAEQRNVSASEVRASIDRKVEAIRQQVQDEKRRRAERK